MFEPFDSLFGWILGAQDEARNNRPREPMKKLDKIIIVILAIAVVLFAIGLHFI